MNIYSKLAIVTAGLALLGSVGTAPAAVFALSGSFTDNGYFNGTYSIDDSASYGPNNSDPNQNQGGLVATLSQFNINFFSTAQSNLREISSTDPNWLVREKFFNPSMGVWGLTFVNPSIQAKFFLLFAGAAPTPQTQQGAVFLAGDLEQPFSTTIATVQTGTSSPVAVPDPSNVAPMYLLGLVGLGAVIKKR